MHCDRKNFLESLYPLSLATVEDHPELLREIFLALSPHKDGVYIGVVMLDGTFVCKNSSELRVGDKLEICDDELFKDKNGPVLAVKGAIGDIGYIPFLPSVLPKLLMSRGLSLWCYLEALDFTNGLLKLAVSIYCEEY